MSGSRAEGLGTFGVSGVHQPPCWEGEPRGRGQPQQWVWARGLGWAGETPGGARAGEPASSGASSWRLWGQKQGPAVSAFQKDTTWSVALQRRAGSLLPPEAHSPALGGSDGGGCPAVLLSCRRARSGSEGREDRGTALLLPVTPHLTSAPHPFSRTLTELPTADSFGRLS